MAVMGLSIQAVSGYVAKLQRLGKLVRVKAPGVRAPRCFTDAAHAQRWVDSHTQAAQQAQQDAMQRLAAETAERQQRDAQKLAAKRAQRAQREQARAQAAQDKAQKAAASAGLRVGRNASVQNVTMFPTKPAAPAPQGQAVETAATVRTVDDTKRPIARWQTQQLPADPRWPSFSAAPLGVNPDTGRPWA